MNQAEILTELKLTDNNSRTSKPYAARLLSVLNLINSLEKLPGFKVIFNGLKGNVEMVSMLPVIDRESFKKSNGHDDWDAYRKACNSQDNLKEIYGLIEQWQQVTVKHNTGHYSFPFPAGNKFYDALAGMAGEAVYKEPEAPVQVLETIVVGSNLFKSMASAVKFISRDDMRPVMQHVCISIEKNKASVVATDAHRLFMSQKVYADRKQRTEIMVSEKDAKIIAKLSFEDELTEISILNDNRVMIGGQVFGMFTDAKYPDYRVVVPSYKKYMEFEREDFIKNVKCVIPYTNKSTTQVLLNLNGQILLCAQDVDFSFEGGIKMRYLKKQFKDTQIAFNGKFLVEALSIFKEKNIKMFTDGVPGRAGIFTNGKDTVLIMPLMLNNYSY